MKHQVESSDGDQEELVIRFQQAAVALQEIIALRDKGEVSADVIAIAESALQRTGGPFRVAKARPAESSVIAEARKAGLTPISETTAGRYAQAQVAKQLSTVMNRGLPKPAVTPPMPPCKPPKAEAPQEEVSMAMRNAFMDAMPTYARHEVDHPNDTGRINWRALDGDDALLARCIAAAIKAAPADKKAVELETVPESEDDGRQVAWVNLLDAAKAFVKFDTDPAIMIGLSDGKYVGDKLLFLGLGTKKQFMLMSDGRSGAQMDRDYAKQQADALDAARWRALLGSARIRPMGSAGLERPEPNGYAHMGMEIWTTYGKPGEFDFSESNALGIKWLTTYADIARAEQSENAVAEASST
jgi:hypothetical protein